MDSQLNVFANEELFEKMIAEADRKKRHWLRSELISFGYIALQKSVWIGNCPLPDYFIHHIDDLNISKEVHIFTVSKSGTI